MKFSFFKTFLAFILLSGSLFLQAKDIIIYHTSDVHGYYFAQENQKGKMQGGFPALMAFMKEDSSMTKNYLLLDSGDFSQGNLEVNASKGMLSVPVYNLMGYDAVTIGNHEFDFGTNIGKISDELRADVLAANIENMPDALPYKIYTVKGMKIAVIGIAMDGDKNKTYKFKDMYKSYAAAAAAVAKQKPDAVVLLIHASNHDPREYVKPVELVKSASYPVHVSLNGHMHDRRIEKIENTLYVDSGERAQEVSKITLTFDDATNEFKEAKAKRIPLLVKKTGEDRNIKDFLLSAQNPDFEQVLAKVKYTFDYLPSKKNTLDTPLGNLMADVIRDKAEAELAVINTKTFRNFIPKGTVTKRNMLLAMPYSNKLAVMELDGAFIEEMVKKGLMPDSSIFQYSGNLQVKAVFKGGELESADIKFNGAPLEHGRKYRVGTNDFLAFAGTYEAVVFNEIPSVDKKLLGYDLEELLVEKLKNSPSVKPAKAGRITKVVKK
ncbi:2',3'-cyclic-nucleotide 2'-phosphodiesterase/3'-nucleotidase; bifunctional 2' [Elusimicrobium posterum]|uniref:bifunctional metallophosphatase/5'-nucleotidase n=1 Tax=Elusimicrobium posterum TaxID=3116653 RepID=UPI003C78D35E